MKAFRQATGNATYMDQVGFNLAFGLNGGEKLDPKIGSWDLKYITKITEVGKAPERTNKVEKYWQCQDNEDGWSEKDIKNGLTDF